MKAFKYGKSFAGIVYLNIFATYLFPHVVPNVHEIDRGSSLERLQGSRFTRRRAMSQV